MPAWRSSESRERPSPASSASSDSTPPRSPIAVRQLSAPTRAHHHDDRRYGDLLPTTTGARILAAAVMLVRFGFVAILTGAIAERFLSRDLTPARAEAMDELRFEGDEVLRRIGDLRARLDELEKLVEQR
jgi:hypothetical protein